MNFRSISLFTFGIAIFYAPLAYGSTTQATSAGLSVLLLVASAAALIHKIVAREPFAIPAVPLLCVLALATIAVAGIINARFEVNPKTLDFVSRGAPIPFLPSALDRVSAHSEGFKLLSLAGAFLVLTDLTQHRRERWMLLGALAMSGLLIAVLGIYFKFQRSEIPMFRGAPDRFATYLYHGNAAAFLNLCWPAAMALLARAMQKENHFGRALWANALLFTFGALFVNASKIGHGMAIPAFLLGAILVWRCLGSNWAPSTAVLSVVSLVLLAAMLILILPTLTIAIERWGTFSEGGFSGRTMAYGAALRMISDAPLWGVGPGCFRWGFPFYTAHLGEAIKGVWIHAHQDYIQTFVEWGLVGGSIWMVLVGGGLWRGWSKLTRGAKELSTVAAVLGLTITAVHCLVDFPMQIASLQYLAAVYLAILWSAREKHRKTHSQPAGVHPEEEPS